ncbi:hypothetical protein diail_7623 [Diaporthe ilicicola]|nr:hypothetical protein diail_7623 [Diaporthe ilicicola]
MSRDAPELRIEGVLYENDTFPQEVSEAQQAKDTVGLPELLRDQYVKGDPSHFYPLKRIYRLFTRERVLAELRSYDSLPNADQYVDYICTDEATTDKKPAYIRIFAILVLIDEGERIRDFIDAKLSDETLPFHRRDDVQEARRKSHLFLKNTDSPIKVFNKWKTPIREAFEHTQWMLLVPCLDLDHNNTVKEYDFCDRHILPWCKSTKTSDMQSSNAPTAAGAYGKVYCVDIHSDCHGFQQVLGTIQVHADKFAVKELLKSDFNKEFQELQFKQELEHLKRFNGLVHDHLVTLLASVSKGATPEDKQYHYVFPYARFDLPEYWETTPNPSWDILQVRWVAKQLEGIMGAMKSIHEPLHLHSNTQVAKYGMHTDLKPDNILWFGSIADVRGILVISDFGLANMHSDKSRSNIPNEKIPALPGYRPPECDIQGGQISRRYDIWTLGCLFLEILTWLMGGQQLIKEFQKERKKTTYVTGAKRDIFYNVKRLQRQEPNAIHVRESIIDKKTAKDWYALEVKPEVKNWIQRLHSDDRCPGLIHDILEMIEGEMLVILSRNEKGATTDRSTSKVLSAKLSGFVSRCETDNDYCFRGKPYKDRLVRAPTVVVAPLNEEAENSIKQLRADELQRHDPLDSESRTKSTVIWEELPKEG